MELEFSSGPQVVWSMCLMDVWRVEMIEGSVLTVLLWRSHRTIWSLQPELNDLFFGPQLDNKAVKLDFSVALLHQYHFYLLGDVTDTCHGFGVWFIYVLFYFVVRFVLLWRSTSCLCLFPSFSVLYFLIIPVFFLHSLSARLFPLCSHFVPCGFWFRFVFLCLCFLAFLRDFWTLDSGFLFRLLPACLCVFASGFSAFCTS